MICNNTNIKDKGKPMLSSDVNSIIENSSAIGNNLDFKPELLAPAGREDVFYAVLEAGADAVYMAGKLFNMRRHRKDFNFTNKQVEKLVEFAHQNGKKVYITVNSLLAQAEVPQMTDYLKYLDDIAVDSVILQDFGVVNLCHEHDIKVPLHSSTMMNVNSVEYAAFLKENGFTRVVTSRDITVDEVRRIHEQAGIETEFFLHGDMCSVQSGQCYGSGMIFGKSSNRGQCMKLCRWAYDMVSENSGQKIAENAYLLATKDLCLLEQIPELVNSGISSLKIEGRMKPAEQLSRIISLYRSAIDSYCEDPLSYNRKSAEITDLHRNRVRNLSTGFAFKTPGEEYFDLPGEREPMFLSYAGIQSSIKDWSEDPFEKFTPELEKTEKIPEISCVVGDIESARSAMKNGADNIILSWEGTLQVESGWKKNDLEELICDSRKANIRVIIETPKILTERELKELELTIIRYPEIETYSLTGAAAIPMLRKYNKNIWVSYNCNILNAEAYKFFKSYGCERFLPSLESSYENIADFRTASPEISTEIPAHGALTAMLVEHCLIAMNTQHISKKEFCKMPCSFDSFSIVDKRGQKRRVMPDRYCRNHIMMEYDLCILPALKSFLALNPASLRIDARLYSADETGFITKIYSEAVKGPANLDQLIQEFKEHYVEKKFSFAAYVKGISKDKDISLLGLKKEEKKIADCAKKSPVA